MQTSYKACIVVMSVLVAPTLPAMQSIDEIVPVGQFAGLNVNESKVEELLQPLTYALPQSPSRKRTRREALDDITQKLTTLRNPWLQEDNENKKICAVVPEQCKRVKYGIIDHLYKELHEKELSLFTEAKFTGHAAILKEVQRHINARTKLVDDSLNRVRGVLQRSKNQAPKDIIRQNVTRLRLLLEKHCDEEKETIESAIRESKLQEFYKTYQDEQALEKQLIFLRSQKRKNRMNLPEASGSLRLEPAQPHQEVLSADPTHFFLAAQSSYELALPVPVHAIMPPPPPQKPANSVLSAEPQQLPDEPCSCVSRKQQEES